MQSNGKQTVPWTLTPETQWNRLMTAIPKKEKKNYIYIYIYTLIKQTWRTDGAAERDKESLSKASAQVFDVTASGGVGPPVFHLSRKPPPSLLSPWWQMESRGSDVFSPLLPTVCPCGPFWPAQIGPFTVAQVNCLQRGSRPNEWQQRSSREQLRSVKLICSHK